MQFQESFISPIGKLTVTADEEYLLSVDFDTFELNCNTNYVTNRAVQQLKEYFDGSRKSFELPLKFDGTEFYIKVWKELCNIPYSETCTYGDIAKKLNNPYAFRAVGMANKHNPLPIIVPCHRVVSSDGLGGYSLGLDRKIYLLEMEKKYSGSV